MSAFFLGILLGIPLGIPLDMFKESLLLRQDLPKPGQPEDLQLGFQLLYPIKRLSILHKIHCLIGGEGLSKKSRDRAAFG